MFYIFPKKSIYRPLFKKLLRFRKNILLREKVLRFKKKKWESFIHFAKRRTLARTFINKKKKRRYNRYFYRPINMKRYVIPKRIIPIKYSKQYKKILMNALAFRCYYGGLDRQALKKYIRKARNTHHTRKKDGLIHVFLELFERRLDTILFRAKFAHSIRNAQQLILHRKVLVNKKIVSFKSYSVKNGDLIEIIPTYSNLKLILHNMIVRAKPWPLPPQYLAINFRTLQIIFLDMSDLRLNNSYGVRLDIHGIIKSYLRQ